MTLPHIMMGLAGVFVGLLLLCNRRKIANMFFNIRVNFSETMRAERVEYDIHDFHIHNKYGSKRSLPLFIDYRKMIKKELDLSFLEDFLRNDPTKASLKGVVTSTYYLKDYDLSFEFDHEKKVIKYVTGKDWRLSFDYRMIFSPYEKTFYIGEGLYFEGNIDPFESVMAVISLRSA